MRIVIVGGGSRQWGPKLVTDLLTTPSLSDADIVLHDIDEASLERVHRYAQIVAEKVDSTATIDATSDRRAALRDADFVVVTISTGGFESMTHDLEIPARYGIRQSVGDTVGPGGISRSIRNIPVLVDIARDMERLCPAAWMLNITNPMTCLTRAVARETSIRVVGLCHEVVIMSWFVAIACGVQADDVEFGITGVNHLPWITELSIGGHEGFDVLRRAVAERPEAKWFADEHALKLGLLDRYGALPGAGDRHVAEFFPWVLTPESEWGKSWGIHLTSIDDRERDEAGYRRALLDVVEDGKDAPKWASGEMVAPLVDSLVTGERRELPLNIPNIAQAPYLPPDVVVETMCTVDAAGVRGRDEIVPPAACAAWIRRHVEVQEMTVEAAVAGDRDALRAAMALDPLCSRADLHDIEAMTDELLDATAAWLPQFV
jgi:alpha-galactosidase/6-phospho-beta-glucosidase family protein